MVELVMRRIHGCLPDLSFFEFAIPQDRIHSPVSLVHLGSKRHTAGSTDALPQRTCRHVAPRCMFHVRMPLQHMTCLTKCIQFFFGEISFFCQYGIEGRCCMAFGEDQTVTVSLLRIFGIYLHFMEKQ